MPKKWVNRRLWFRLKTLKLYQQIYSFLSPQNSSQYLLSKYHSDMAESAIVKFKALRQKLSVLTNSQQPPTHASKAPTTKLTSNLNHPIKKHSHLKDSLISNTHTNKQNNSNINNNSLCRPQKSKQSDDFKKSSSQPEGDSEVGKRTHKKIKSLFKEFNEDQQLAHKKLNKSQIVMYNGTKSHTRENHQKHTIVETNKKKSKSLQGSYNRIAIKDFKQSPDRNNQKGGVNEKERKQIVSEIQQLIRMKKQMLDDIEEKIGAQKYWQLKKKVELDGDMTIFFGNNKKSIKAPNLFQMQKEGKRKRSKSKEIKINWQS